MVQNIPAHVITDVRDQSENSRNPVFAHLNFYPDLLDMLDIISCLRQCHMYILYYRIQIKCTATPIIGLS